MIFIYLLKLGIHLQFKLLNRTFYISLANLILNLKLIPRFCHICLNSQLNLLLNLRIVLILLLERVLSIFDRLVLAVV